MYKVAVKQIIEDDPSNPVDESITDYSDEDNTNVENLLRLIYENHRFNNAMFKGGAFRVDVERKREVEKRKGKQRKSHKSPVISETIESPDISAMVYDKMNPDISRIEEKIRHIKTSINEACSAVAGMESQVGTIVEEKLKSMMECQMGPMLDSKLFQLKGEIRVIIENSLKRPNEDSVIRPLIPKSLY